MQMTDSEIKRLEQRFSKLIHEIVEQIKDTGNTNITDTDFVEIVEEELNID